MAFPEGLPIADSIHEARKERNRAIIRVALVGIAVRMLIVVSEFLGFLFFDSKTLLLDSLATLADVISSVVLVLSVKLAERPPDNEHPFGHGRYEPIAGLQLGLFLTIAGGGLLWQQIASLWQQVEPHSVNSYVWIFALVTVILLEFSYRRMKRVAVEQKSPALLAEALHFRTDSLNSILALIALLAAAFFPEVSGVCDRVGAILIALCMCGMGLFASKKNLNQLLDRTPEQELFERVQTAAHKVNGVEGTEKIRIQHYGPDAHVDIDIEVDPLLTVETAHTISQHVRRSIQLAWPQVQDVTVHIEPYYKDDH
ncbi:MAG: cation transporter [Verrucomicrobia bacterium]|nr:cation transporter [Verrucomicrobiota bacterium]MBS0636043.1 cation transporter [Verrucomicrobiota bacterium]